MSPVRMSRVENASRLVLEFKEAFNQHDIDALLKLITDNCIFESAEPSPDGTIYTGKEKIAQYCHQLFERLSQIQIKGEEVMTAGSHCIMRLTYQWLDADGTRRHLRGVDVFKIRDDLIYERRSYIKGSSAGMDEG